VNCVKKFVDAIVDGVITKEHSQSCLHLHSHHISVAEVWCCFLYIILSLYFQCISHFDAAHRATFVYIIHFLRDLVAHASTNDMNPTTASELF
jgi:hypothetical protein